MTKQIHFRLSPLFFVTAFLIGFLGTGNLTQSFIWVAAIFISILIHELGHALSALVFDRSSIVQFTAFGGVTIPLGKKLNLLPEFIMVLMGPLFGFALFVLSSYIGIKVGDVSPNFTTFIDAMKFINLFWTIINLIPILPLDGGQLLRIILEAVFGINGRKYCCIFGGIVALGLALVAILFKLIILSIFFFFFAFQNFELFKQLKNVSDQDEDEPLKDELKEAMMLAKKHDQNALEKLEEVRSHAGKGLVFIIASQELAETYIQANDFQKAFDVLKPIEEKLMDSGKLLLQHAAFEIKDDEVVLSIAGNMMVSSPDSEAILRALAAAARKKDLEAALGWLQTAKDFGCKNLKEYLDQPYFDAIKQEKTFLDAIKNI